MSSYLSNITSISIKFSSFIGTIQFGKNKFVQENMIQLESEVKEADKLITIRTQKRKEAAKKVDEEKKIESKKISQKKKRRVAEMH